MNKMLYLFLLLITAMSTLQAASLVGSLEGELDVSQGQLNWTLPLEVPVGANGIAPAVNLNYAPGSSNGILGVGFQLGGLSAITRCPASKEYDGVDGGLRFDMQSPYCLDGQRLLPAGDGVSYRTAIDSFSKIIASGNAWTVYTKDGYVLDYGNTADSKVLSPSNGNAVLAWRVNQKRDRFNNAMNYTYTAIVGQGVNELSSIQWGIHEVKLNYQTRTDQFSAWQFGDSKTLQQRIGNIQVLSNGNVLRQYQLGYGYVGTGSFSRLQSIALCNSVGACAPATQLKWQADISPSITEEMDAWSVTGFANFVLGDMNVDGVTDICYLQNGLHCKVGASIWNVAIGASSNHQDSAATLALLDLNNDTYSDYCFQDVGSIQCGINNVGSGFSKGNQVWSTDFNRSQAVRFVDLNADHLPDICDINPINTRCAYNTGSGFGAPFTLLAQGWPDKQGTDIHNGSVGFMDINGDGLIDLCGARVEGFVCSLRKYNAQQQPVFSNPMVYSVIFGKQWGDKIFANTFRYGDLNADGLPDACWRDASGYTCSINTGTTFATPTHWANVTGWAEDELAHATLMLNDIDSDGRADLCVATPDYALHCGRNAGAGFASLQAYAPLRYGEGIIDLPGAEKARPRALPLRLADMDADGSADICYRGYSGITCGLAGQLEHSLLVGVTTGYKNTTEITYGFLADPTVYTRETSVVAGLANIQPNRRVVQRIATSDGAGGMKAVNYAYQGLRYSPSEGSSRGFHYITETDETSKRKTVTEFYQEKDLNGRAKQVASSLNGVTLQSVSSTFLVQASIASSGKTILPLKTIETTYEYNSHQPVSVQTTTYSNYDAYGNAQRITVDSRTPDGSEWNTKTTTSTYWNDPTNWLLGKPTAVTAIHQNAIGSVSRSTAFTYYANGAAQTETLQPGHALALVSTFTYDRFGNKVQTTVSGQGQGVQPRSSSVEYDSSGLYVLKQVNALGYTETFVPDPLCGAPKSQTGPNGLTTTWQYDSLCQKTREIRADGTQTLWQRAWSQGYSAGYGVDDHSIYTVTETSSGSAPKTVWYDGLGREVRTATKGFSKLQGSEEYETIFQDKVYDARGLLVKATLPYEEGKFPGDNSYWVTSDYDALGRITAQNRPTESGQPIVTHYAYNGLTTTVTDPNGHSTATTKNLADKPVRVVEGNGASTITYSYDALGNLLKTDTNGQVVEMGYDARGNKAWMKDPAMGSWQYQYNAYGELVWQRDAKGQTTAQEYDLLGRMVKRTTVEGIATWEYDTAANGKGKLAAERSPDAETTYTYDTKGRPVATTRKIANGTYVSKLGYDQYSRPAVEVYPDGVQVNRHYTDTGYLERITTPKGNIWDYDYTELEKKLQLLGQTLANLQVEERTHTEKALVYLKKAEEYALTAKDWEQQGQQLQQEVDSLNNFAKDLRATADGHLRTAAQYARLSSEYAQRYGDLFFNYIGTSGGSANYRTAICTAYDSKGDCKATQNIDMSIPLSVLPSSCLMKSNTAGNLLLNTGTSASWKNTLWCEFGPARNAALASQYARYAQILADEGYRGGEKPLPNSGGLFQLLGSAGSVLSPLGLDGWSSGDPLSVLPSNIVSAIRDAAAGKVCRNEANDYETPQAPEYYYHQYYQWAVSAINKSQCASALNVTSAQVKPSEAYSRAAEDYRAAASGEQEDAALIQAAANREQQDANGLLSRAAYYRSLAETQYAKAREETDWLKTIADKLEDYRNASDEIQRTLDTHNANGEEILLWAATSHDASGRLQGELAGNGLLTRREFDPYSGHLNRMTTGIEGSSTNPLIRDLNYTYDGADNVTTRNDAVNGQNDSYSYDAFDRLTDAVRTTNSGQGGFALHYGYDVYGNLTNKSDAGNMVYDPTNNRLKTLSKTNGTQKQYSYDANGNMLQAGDNVVKWASFNQPLEIRNAKTNSTATFLYDANQERVQQANGTDGKSETTTYVSKAFEVTQNDNGVNDRLTQYKHQIYAEGQVVAIQIRTVKNGVKAPDETRYLHSDALGNVDTITDSHGTVIQRISYDPFGKRTVTAGTDPDLKAWTARGFTGHEHLDNLGLIHMNARLYDPEIGRFISADTLVPDPSMSQSYNRYIYVYNNPLKYTDPSGHDLFDIIGDIFDAIFDFISNNIVMIASIFVMVTFPVAGPAWFTGMVRGAAGGFVGGLLSTNSLSGALQGAFWGGLGGAVAGYVGHGLGFGNSPSPFGSSAWLAHGASQGVLSQLRGGNFKSGFVGAIVGGLSPASGMTQLGIGNTLSRTVIASVFGGLASVATGGSFEDGAMSAAFRHLFNEEMKVYTFKDGFGHAAMEIARGHTRTLYDPNGSFRQNGVRGPAKTSVSDGEYIRYWNTTTKETVYVQSIEITSSEYDQVFESLELYPDDIGFFDCALSTSGRIWSNIPRFEDLGAQFFPSGIREYFEDKGYPAIPYSPQ